METWADKAAVEKIESLRAENAALKEENKNIFQQLCEYDGIRAKQQRYKMYLSEDAALPTLADCLRGCIGDIKKDFPIHANGLYLTIENIEALILERTALREKVRRLEVVRDRIASDIAVVSADGIGTRSMYELGLIDGLNTTLVGMLEQIEQVLHDSTEPKEDT